MTQNNNSASQLADYLESHRQMDPIQFEEPDWSAFQPLDFDALKSAGCDFNPSAETLRRFNPSDEELKKYFSVE